MRRWIIFAAGVVALQALTLFLFGQPKICECGYIKVWESVVLGPGNSQHLTDWYTFSHIIHGFIFFWLAKLLFPRARVGVWLLLAVGVEAAWEVLENTPQVIEHYRTQALAQGYTGDSILNSVSDTLAMIVGFFMALKIKWWWVVLLAVALEAFTIYMIRDGLALNVVNLVFPFDSIHEWQAGK
ncbi:MAG: DUF2585 family protein [Candidatus Pacebacteria bacterium]|nr:DUF2585 family protein [Candidatus Paceibacterota bacterium]